jgi:uncharacterized surface protein with fasciclin (FAS1) repeats
MVVIGKGKKLFLRLNYLESIFKSFTNIYKQTRIMKKTILTVMAFLAIGIFSQNASAQTTAAQPAASGNVLATLSNSDNASSYIAMAIALRAAKQEATLTGAGPYTIFAPSNDAFAALTPAQLDALFADPAKLATVLRGHIVTGLNDKKAILADIRATGTSTMKTIDGQTLTLSVNAAKNLVITDAQGNSAKVIKFDMVGSNGVAIGIDAVLYK